MNEHLTDGQLRAALDEELQRRCTETQRSGTPLSIMLIDVDHFKEVNDRYGHLTGDAVLREGLAKLFREESDTRQIIKLKEVYQLLESVTDKCEDVANVIEGIVLENA